MKWIAICGSTILAAVASAPVWASDLMDVSTCRALFAGGAGKPGLYFKLSGADPTPVTAQPIPYDMYGRFYFLADDGKGRSFAVSRETVWGIRTQTTARSAKADETIVRRPAIVTQCSNGVALESFGPNTRYVSLNRYYDHHAPNGGTQRVDASIRRYFHFRIDDPRKPGGCMSSTDDPQVVGDLRQAYGFDDVEPDAVLLASLTSFGKAAARTSKIYSGFTSELAQAAPNEPACFGFIAPLPTRSTYGTQFFPLTRDDQAHDQARTWRPDRTVIKIQYVVQPGSTKAMLIRWQGTTDSARNGTQ